jgi:hypothetical protein
MRIRFKAGSIEMKLLAFIPIMVLLSWGFSVNAFQWSVDEYIENCSVVHQKTIAESDKEIVGYCMGVL